MTEFDLLVVIFFVFASPIAFLFLYVAYRWVRGFRKKDLLPEWSIMPFVECTYTAMSAGLPVQVVGAIKDGTDADSWSYSSTILAVFLAWRLFGLFRETQSEPWATYAAAGHTRFIVGGSLLVIGLLVVNAVSWRSFAPTLLAVAWIPTVAVAGLGSLYISRTRN